MQESTFSDRQITSGYPPAFASLLLFSSGVGGSNPFRFFFCFYGRESGIVLNLRVLSDENGRSSCTISRAR